MLMVDRALNMSLMKYKIGCVFEETFLERVWCLFFIELSVVLKSFVKLNLKKQRCKLQQKPKHVTDSDPFHTTGLLLYPMKT